MGAIYQQKQESIQFYEIVHSTEKTCIHLIFVFEFDDQKEPGEDQFVSFDLEI